MTVTADTIALVSTTWKVDDSGKFTTAIFNFLAPQAKELVDLDAPIGVSSVLYDRLHALMICALFEQGLPNAGISSEKIGDYSYTKEAGISPSMAAYDVLLAKIRAGNLSGDDCMVERSDADMPTQMLDAMDVPDYGRDDGELL